MTINDYTVMDVRLVSAEQDTTNELTVQFEIVDVLAPPEAVVRFQEWKRRVADLREAKRRVREL